MDTTAPKESSNSQRTGVPSSPGKFCGSCASSGGDSGLSEYSSAGDVKGEDDETPGSSGCDIAKGVMVEVVAGSKSWTPSRTDGRAWQAQAGQYDALHATSARLARLAVVTPPRVAGFGTAVSRSVLVVDDSVFSQYSSLPGCPPFQTPGQCRVHSLTHHDDRAPQSP